MLPGYDSEIEMLALGVPRFTILFFRGYFKFLGV